MGCRKVRSIIFGPSIPLRTTHAPPTPSIGLARLAMAYVIGLPARAALWYEHRVQISADGSVICPGDMVFHIESCKWGHIDRVLAFHGFNELVLRYTDLTCCTSVISMTRGPTVEAVRRFQRALRWRYSERYLIEQWPKVVDDIFAIATCKVKDSGHFYRKSNIERCKRILQLQFLVHQDFAPSGDDDEFPAVAGAQPLEYSRTVLTEYSRMGFTEYSRTPSRIVFTEYLGDITLRSYERYVTRLTEAPDPAVAVAELR